MTRPKVPPDQRQRTAQACESCKRRKQKCNGLQPCNTCSKRGFDCIYVERDAPSPTERPSKKQRSSDNNIHSSGADSDTSPVKNESHHQHTHQHRQLPPSPLPPFQSAFMPQQSSTGGLQQQQQQQQQQQPQRNGRQVTGGAFPPVTADESAQRAARSLQQFSLPRKAPDDRTKSFLSIVTGLSGHEGEALVYGQSRMLQDSTGRLLYVGDAATLSFLQLLRLMLEPLIGHTAFTDDPRRHMITESQFSLDPNTTTNTQLPDYRTARVLAESFFINTHGLLNIFGRDVFMSALDASYEDPLAIEPAWLCHLNLVFAIGLLLATPPPGSEDAEVISRLRDHHKDLDEQFYLNAKSVNDPLTGFEDADFWSTQALLLMAVYMLTKSKRNTAFALLGMAVRSAYALGLHREDTLVVFNPDEQEARRNLWKSLFVMDRYLALSLGRPSAIFDDTLYNSSTKISTNGSRHNSYSDSPSFEESSTYSIDAAVKSCSTVGKILKEVYQQRKISTKLAHEIAQQCREFPHKIAPTLHCWPKFVAKSPAHGISVLHVNLFWIHSAMLLTRPFFLFVLNFEISRCITPSAPTQVRRGFRRIEKFSEVCISSATHTVSLVKAVYSAGYLPRRNPWVIYFLASAAFVLLANEIIPLHRHHAAQDSIRDALDIMAYCGVDDAQAERLHYVLNTFRESVEDERSKRSGNVNQLAPVQSKHQTVDSILGPMSISNQDPSLPLPQPVPTATSFTQPYFSQPTSTTSYQPMPQPSQSASSPAAPSFMTSQQAPGKSSSSTPAPLEPLPPPSVPPNPLSPASASRTMPTAGGPLDPLNPNLPFANLLDFASFGGPGDATSSMYGSATGGTGHTGTSGASDTDFGPDENIDFEAFWTWPTTTTGTGLTNEGNADGAGLMPGSMHSNQSMYGTQMV